MQITYDVILKNIEQTEYECQRHEVLKKFKEGLKDNLSVDIPSAFNQYKTFLQWKFKHEKRGNNLISEKKIEFDELKSEIINNSQTEFASIMKNMTKRKFINLLRHKDKFDLYNGQSNNRRRKIIFGNNLEKNEVIIMNWIIQNEIDFEQPYFAKYYRQTMNSLPDSLVYTQDNTQIFLRNFKEFLDSYPDVDMVNINFNSAMKQLSKIFAEQVRAKASTRGTAIYLNNDDSSLCFNKSYQVLDVQIETTPCLGCGSVKDLNIGYQVKGEDEKKKILPVTYFKRMSVHRHELLCDILSES